MSSYRRVLALLHEGTPLIRIAETMNMREDALRAMVQSMVREGHLRDLDCDADSCSACPMADGCPIPQDEPASYVISEDGTSFLLEKDDSGSD